MKKHEFIRQSKVILVSFLGMKTPIHYNTGIGVLGCQMCRTTGLLFIFLLIVLAISIGCAIIKIAKQNAPLAQLAEQLTLNQWVIRSIRIGGTIFLYRGIYAMTATLSGRFHFLMVSSIGW
jgi:hypothetical protein